MKTKVLEIFNKAYRVIKPYRKKLIDPLLKILGIIIICAILVRLISGNETLSDYADKHPDIAYTSSQDTSE